eukprot:g14644.t1
MNDKTRILNELNDRSREVFRRVVEGYLTNGEPVGSRTLTRSMSEKVSAATIRNVMQDLEFLGLLDSPHVSAGRIPTQQGLRMFVDGLLEVGDLDNTDREKIDATIGNGGSDVGGMLDRIGSALSGATQGASLVLAPKHEAPIKHIEFVALGSDRALTPSSMREAANFVNALAEGRTLSELGQVIKTEIAKRRQEIDVLARDLIDSGWAEWDDQGARYERLIVRGRANLLGEDAAEEDLERIRTLFDDLERKRDIAEFLELAEEGEGVRIFIGSENKLFSLSGSSLVVSPYMNADRKIIGAVGVIGPTRLNYGRIVPIVDYTAQLADAYADEIDEMDDETIEIDALRAERDGLKDKWMRAMADAENARKRADKQRREAEMYGGSKLARDLLPVYDNMKRALEAAGEKSEETSALIEGVELTMRELLNTFKKHGIEPIVPEVGDKFDPNVHEAMFEAPVPGTKAGDIIQVSAEGFWLSDRLLRPAQVGVSSTPA